MSIDRVGDNRVRLGRLAEEFCAQYIQRTLGWHVIDRNWRIRQGELDIVAEDGMSVVVIEVRSRQGVSRNLAAEAVQSTKMRQVERVAHIYLASHQTMVTRLIRFDVIVVLFRDMAVVNVDHIRDAWQSA